MIIKLIDLNKWWFKELSKSEKFNIIKIERDNTGISTDYDEIDNWEKGKLDSIWNMMMLFKKRELYKKYNKGDRI